MTASSASNGAVSYALQDPTSTVLTIHPTSGLITLLAPGSAVIVASQAQGTLHEAPSNITATITVTAATTTLQGATLTNTQSFANVDLSGASLTNTNITNTNFSSGRLNNSNFSGAAISGANMSSAQLVSASLANATVSNTNFTSGQLTNANLNGATITSSNMTSADLSGATMRGATITGTDFTSAVLRQTDLSGANVRSSIFNNANLSGSTLARMDASGASFINADLRNANLSNADFTNANMTNANISGVDLTNVSFTVPQKLQLLKNTDNRPRGEIQVSQVAGNVLLPILSAGSAVRDVPGIANATIKVMLPTTSLVSSDTITDITLDIANFSNFYFPIGENEYFQIEGVKYYISGSTVRNFATGAVVENTSYGVKAIRLLAGSLTIIVNSQNTLSSSSFVVPTIKQNTDTPFSPTTLPTSNSSAPIVYTSSNTSVATINSSTGVITPVADACGFVRFTASQVATETHESASITSNELFIYKKVDLTLVGLNQTFSLSTLASLDASSITVESTDATAIFYVRLSDMTNLFQYQTDSFDVNNFDASDVKYYVFHRTMPAELHINPSHAMMNKTESAGMLGLGVQEISADKSLVKHDFIRYIALRLFNTHYGVDLFQNEKELQENITYLGETVQHNIDTILSGISTTSASQDMAYDASGNKYLTNDASGNT
ncbi:MAG: pentapeptide repeat-containing protein, partial [Sphingomonadales bacterium]|nr:pentapeptide repeat-containing protein [Sphingomonadales bacterium]